MNEAAVTINDILIAREHRANKQKALLERFQKPIICFTMNIPGSVKNNPLIGYAFKRGAISIEQFLGTMLLYQDIHCLPTGCEGYFVSDMEALELKKIAQKIEQTGEIGRLFDMDVFQTNGIRITRPEPRQCLLCSEPGYLCARSRKHGLDNIVGKAFSILQNFAVEDISRKAADALVQEAFFTPKPGLVDANNNGAHSDMNLVLMIESARCLMPFFQSFIRAGLNNAPVESYREIGINAEKAMLQTTSGINTHKGAIYAFGIILSAYGLVLGGFSKDVLITASNLAKALCPFEDKSTHGGSVRRKYKVGGAMEEAMAGFPHAVACKKNLNQGKLYALLNLIMQVQDNNVLYRGGREGLSFIQEQAESILLQPASQWEDSTFALDKACIERNLSPGGCADLFALALFLRMMDDAA